jgi:hypothetical protein
VFYDRGTAPLTNHCPPLCFTPQSRGFGPENISHLQLRPYPLPFVTSTHDGAVPYHSQPLLTTVLSLLCPSKLDIISVLLFIGHVPPSSASSLPPSFYQTRLDHLPPHSPPTSPPSGPSPRPGSTSARCVTRRPRPAASYTIRSASRWQQRTPSM